MQLLLPLLFFSVSASRCVLPGAVDCMCKSTSVRPKAWNKEVSVGCCNKYY